MTSFSFIVRLFIRSFIHFCNVSLIRFLNHRASWLKLVGVWGPAHGNPEGSWARGKKKHWGGFVPDLFSYRFPHNPRNVVCPWSSPSTGAMAFDWFSKGL
jgi:hypothetical protein